MTRLSDHMPRAQEPSLLAAIVKRGADDLSDEIRVVLETDPKHALKVRDWMPRGDVLPSAGDRALIAFDDQGAPWLVCWTPS